MEDSGKTRIELVNEVQELRRRVAELEDENARRCRAEEGLKRQEEKYRSLLDSISAIVWLIDRDGRVVFANRSAFDRRRVPVKDIIGKSLQEVFQPDRASKLAAENREVMESETPKLGVIEKITLSTGEEVWSETDKLPYYDENGHVAGVVIFGAGITELKKAEAVLLESEAKYRSVVENSLAGVYIYQDGLFRYVNRRWCEIYGYAEEEVVDKLGPLDVTRPADRRSFEKDLSGRLAGRPENVRFTHRCLRKDGATIVVEVFGSPMTYEGRPAVSGTVYDMTEREKEQEELRQKTALLEAVLDASLEGITVVDGRKKILQNQRAKDLLKLPPDLAENDDDRVQAEWLATIARDPKEFRERINYMLTNPPETLRDEFELRDGTVLDAYSSPIIGADAKYYGRIWTVRDITDRKRSEEALRTSQLQLSEAADLAHIVYWELDAEEETVLVFNDSFYAFYGTTAEQEGGYRMTWEEYVRRFIHPDDRPAVVAGVEQIASRPGLPIPDVEHRIIRRDGKVRHIVVRSTIVRDESGRIVKRFGANQDITDRKNKDLALLESEKQYRDLVESANSIILRLDGKANVIFMNEFAQRFFGYSENEIIGRNVVGAIVPETESTGRDLKNMFQDLLSDPDRHASNVNENMRRSGERLWVAWANKPVFDENGKLKEITCIGNDVTDRKLAEDALEESEAKFRDLTEKSLVGIYLVQDDLFKYVNSKLAEILGYSVDEMANKMGPKETTFPEDWPLVEENMRRRLSRDARFANYNFRVWKKNLEARDVEVYSSRTIYRGKPAVIGALLDVTERKSLESQFRQAQKMEAIGTLAGGVAHDFNNFLTVIMGFGNLIQISLDPDDRNKPYIDQIVLSCEKAADLVQSLLAFSRKQRISREPREISGLVRSAAKLLRRLLTEDIELRLECAGNAVALLDVSQIDQALMNLATNARDAMPDGGLLVIKTENAILDEAFKKAHGFGKPGAYVRLSVSDTGTGMDEKTLSRIFDPFFTTKEVGKGTGLGLASVYGIVKQHEGYVVVKSEPLKGTTFDIYLPVVAMSGSTSTEAHIEVRGGSETILILEDDRDVRGMIVKILSDQGYSTVEAGNGDDAVRVYREHKDAIDLIILDVVMPGRNGRQALDEISLVNPKVKAIFMSGYTGDIVIEKGVQKEDVEFLQKPLSATNLLTKVREVLDR